MRQLLSFPCEGATLGASLDAADGGVGVLIVTGGTQTRIGSHRMFERLAQALANAGHPCLRFDRRGVGDSGGSDPDFRGNGKDIAAAAKTLRANCPHVRAVIGLGLCDGATSLALFGAEADIQGLILINPWFVEAAANEPAAAAIKHHYRRRLLSLEGWKKILTGSISYKKLFRGVIKAFRKPAPHGLPHEVAVALGRSGVPVALILASGDATAIAAADAWASTIGRHSPGAPIATIDSDSHTFARPGDMDRLEQACLASLEHLQPRPLSGGD